VPSIKEQIVNDIKAHIQSNGGEYNNWHVGVCSNIHYQTLVEAKARHQFIARQAYSAYVAAEVQDYFVTTIGTDGGTCAEGTNADIIYAYKKSTDISERNFPSKDTSSENVK